MEFVVFFYNGNNSYVMFRGPWGSFLPLATNIMKYKKIY